MIRVRASFPIRRTGTATVAGFDLAREQVKVRKAIGYVSQSGSTAGIARAGEEIVDHALLYGISASQAEKRGKELFEQLELEGMWARQPKTRTILSPMGTAQASA